MIKGIKKFGAILFEYFRTTDTVLLSMSIALSVLSCLLILSLYPESISSYRPVYMQMGASLIGIFCAVILSLLDYRSVAKLWKIYGSIALLLSLLVFTPLGQLRGGTGMGSNDLNWLNLGFVTLQPSEFLKVAFILTFSFHCHTVRRHINTPKNLALIALHGAVPIGIIGLQSDFGTMIIFVMIFACILFVSGVEWKYLLGAAGISLIALIIFWNFVLPDYLKNRFTAVYNLDANKLGLGLQQYQGRITLGSGQIFGKGFSSDNLLTTTPELYNDMMFAHLGQVLGFFGCLVVSGWILFICLRILQNARYAKDQLGQNICVGVFAVIFFQTVINVGMVLCVLPVIGITLPLLSAGGSSVLSIYLCIGLAMSVYGNRSRPNLF